MKKWVWLNREVVLAVHEAQLAEHGGGRGIREPGLFESALARPLQLAEYGSPAPDAAALAACYGYGLSRNHPFVDGNKRTGFVAFELFLQLNGFELEADDASCVLTMLAVSSGEMSEHAFAAWARARVKKMQ